MIQPPDWTNPIVWTRTGSGWTRRFVEMYLGKRFDRPSPFAILMLVVLVGLFFAFALLITSKLWYIGLCSLVSAISLFLLLPVSRINNHSRHR